MKEQGTMTEKEKMLKQLMYDANYDKELKKSGTGQKIYATVQPASPVR